MDDVQRALPDGPALRILQPDEEVTLIVQAVEAVVLVTDRRLVVATDQHVELDAVFADIRRIQFDVERDVPATFVVVPEHIQHEPQVLRVEAAEILQAARAIAVISDHLR